MSLRVDLTIFRKRGARHMVILGGGSSARQSACIHRATQRTVQIVLRREPLTLETSVPGVFAAGDIRAGAMIRRVSRG